MHCCAYVLSRWASLGCLWLMTTYSGLQSANLWAIAQQPSKSQTATSRKSFIIFIVRHWWTLCHGKPLLKVWWCRGDRFNITGKKGYASYVIISQITVVFFVASVMNNAAYSPGQCVVHACVVYKLWLSNTYYPKFEGAAQECRYMNGVSLATIVYLFNILTMVCWWLIT